MMSYPHWQDDEHMAQGLFKRLGNQQKLDTTGTQNNKYICLETFRDGINPSCNLWSEPKYCGSVIAVNDNVKSGNVT